MFASSAILRQIRPASAPVFRAAARPIPVQMQMQAPMRINNVGLQMARRWNTQENKGGKSKLVFRFGMRDIPVELYPMAFVVAAAVVGAFFAIGRHFYLDGLRLSPSGKKNDGTGNL